MCCLIFFTFALAYGNIYLNKNEEEKREVLNKKRKKKK